MSAPNLTISIEPLESGKVVYLPLAPQTSNHDPKGRLLLLLSIKNGESSKVKLKDLTISFIGSPQVSSVTIPLDVIKDDGSSEDVEIGTGATRAWWFQKPEQDVIVPAPSPGHIKIGISCHGFDTPANLTLPLAAHKNPTPQGSYLFPARASDFRPTEYWSTEGDTHGIGSQGSQIFAYDMGVIGYDPKTEDWSSRLPGTTGDANDDFRVWGKPIYATADGIVRHAETNVPNNPKPLKWSTKEELDDKTAEQKKKFWGGFEFGGAGNHFYIQHGDEIVLYAHMQKGSLSPKLLSAGATVKAGEFLGLAGNSGSSTGPHLHIHTIQGTQPEQGPLRPMLFRDAFVISRSALKPPDPKGPWVKMKGRGIPPVLSAIWPAVTEPAWYPPGWAEVARHGIPEASYQTEFEHIASSGYRLVWVDGYDVSGKTFFNLIFRPNDGTDWVARHGLTGDEYQEEFNDQKAKGFRLMHIESYISGGKVRYAPIFVKSPGPAFTAYHDRTADEHQKLIDDLTDDGWRPINITVVSLGGKRNYAALYEKRNVGNFAAKSFLTPAEYQTQFDDNDKAGRKLVYLNAYTHSGGPRIVAIWHEKAASPSGARHGMSSSEYQAEFDKQLANGSLTRAVTGYEEGDRQQFAAYWSK